MEWLPRLFPGPPCEGRDFWCIPRLTGNQNGVNLKWKPRFYPANARGGGGGVGDFKWLVHYGYIPEQWQHCVLPFCRVQVSKGHITLDLIRNSGHIEIQEHWKIYVSAGAIIPDYGFWYQWKSWCIIFNLILGKGRERLGVSEDVSIYALLCWFVAI